MIQPTATRAVVVGIAVLILANVLWLGVLWEVKFYQLLRMALLISPGIASFLVAYLAPRVKIVLGLSMAAWGAIIGTFATSIYEHFGVPVDNIGGPMAVFVVLLVYQVVICTVGSVVGFLFWRIKKQGTERYVG